MTAVGRVGVFVAELAVLFSVAFWGLRLPVALPWRVMAGVAAPLLLVVAWWYLGAPRAEHRLTGIAGFGFELAWFGLGVVASASAGRWGWAVVLAGVTVIAKVMAGLDR